MKKIVIASDSFKGSVTSLEVAESAEQAILQLFPNCKVMKVPIADGGEGTVDALLEMRGGTRVTCRIHDPLMEGELQATYAILDDQRRVVMEIAASSGLPLIPVEKRNPMHTSTFGLGEMIKDALLRGCRDFLIGLGGSCTNDAGTGMLQALGFRFLNEEGKALEQGGCILQQIRSVDASESLPLLNDAHFTLVCDVDNPFCGKNGAAYVFARQKGADDVMIEELNSGLEHFASVVRQYNGTDLNVIGGTGAAGGLGGGFLAFLSTTLKPGIETVLEAIDFDRLIEGADLIITGEGKIDRQTVMGKAPYGVLQHGLRRQIPVVAIAGAIEDAELLNAQGFTALFSIQQGTITTLEEAMKKECTMRNMKTTVKQVVRLFSAGKLK
jgi:glycerate kinase